MATKKKDEPEEGIYGGPAGLGNPPRSVLRASDEEVKEAVELRKALTAGDTAASDGAANDKTDDADQKPQGSGTNKG